jgi:hypothetical protein
MSLYDSRLFPIGINIFCHIRGQEIAGDFGRLLSLAPSEMTPYNRRMPYQCILIIPHLFDAKWGLHHKRVIAGAFLVAWTQGF